MESISDLIHVFLHLDEYLKVWSEALGPWLYLVLFAVVFCETGLVVTPILPGDSLLFAVGALAAIGALNLPLIIVLLIAAAILGDAVNYYVGYVLGPRVFRRQDSWLLNKKHLERTQRFYERHGGKTIIWARFIPIIRTFAPFVAGIGRMQYRRFAFFNIAGGVAWVLTFTLGGYFLAETPWVKRNFHIVIVAIIILSVMPAVIEYCLARRRPPVPTSPAVEPPVPASEQ